MNDDVNEPFGCESRRVSNLKMAISKFNSPFGCSHVADGILSVLPARNNNASASEAIRRHTYRLAPDLGAIEVAISSVGGCPFCGPLASFSLGPNIHWPFLDARPEYPRKGRVLPK